VYLRSSLDAEARPDRHVRCVNCHLVGAADPTGPSLDSPPPPPGGVDE